MCSSSISPSGGPASAPPARAPQARSLEHVGLVDARHPPPRGAEGDLGDALDFGDGVRAGVEGRDCGTSGLAVAASFAEVDAPGELAHDEQVRPLDALAPQRARVEQGRAGPDGTQVRVQPEPLAQAEQALLGAGGAGIG
jgi:hypothetical protein